MASIDINELINEFGVEIGRVRGQAIVDRKQHEADMAELQETNEMLMNQIDELNSRLASLEGAFPAEQGDKESSTEAEPQEEQAIPEERPVKKEKSGNRR